ncbi:MAG: hypothetical protein KTR14_05445 [Vampirovibrio sp.]|nr:hypothetical protein [Vampirovibrio sp.]
MIQALNNQYAFYPNMAHAVAPSAPRFSSESDAKVFDGYDAFRNVVNQKANQNLIPRDQMPLNVSRTLDQALKIIKPESLAKLYDYGAVDVANEASDVATFLAMDAAVNLDILNSAKMKQFREAHLNIIKSKPPKAALEEMKVNAQKMVSQKQAEEFSRFFMGKATAETQAISHKWLSNRYIDHAIWNAKGFDVVQYTHANLQKWFEGEVKELMDEMPLKPSELAQIKKPMHSRKAKDFQNALKVLSNAVRQHIRIAPEFTAENMLRFHTDKTAARFWYYLANPEFKGPHGYIQAKANTKGWEPALEAMTFYRDLARQLTGGQQARSSYA